MLRLSAAALVATLALLAAAAVASSQPQSRHGEVWVGLKGWGSIKLAKGVLAHGTVRCSRESCPAVNYLTRGSRAVLIEKPYMGWKFARWNRACKGMRPRCSINLAKVRPNAFGERQVHASATFVPVGSGITRNRPIPLGTGASVNGGWRVQVNSATPDALLSPPAPPGTDYFAANVTISFVGTGSRTPEQDLTWQAIGSRQATYNPGSSPCPDSGPQPPLPTSEPVASGESRSGFVCWRTATSDASSLELYFGSGDLNYPGTTWFALH